VSERKSYFTSTPALAGNATTNSAPSHCLSSSVQSLTGGSISSYSKILFGKDADNEFFDWSPTSRYRDSAPRHCHPLATTEANNFSEANNIKTRRLFDF